ncbi:GT4 family glycosyltransferase PelF [Hydrogenothermus marinus]|uniref:Glycosyltransferase involved in cell wall biosynthesis n=1 Tax=Hydrogenothermus marinus TaxID=133270 RepID=A0A3M0BK03_9AQUI|nr:GT4 family glycosyltransferase PelF [Hydrogenothermus marinus]RMA97660.1 glycosyltransferase involved in cell wall biosynthesis [Hydrogenothermus marinus]
MKSNIDILIIGEGTYPYIRGGVSSWIHQLISGLPEFKFGVLFIGSRREDYGEKRYKFPDNLVYFDEIYIFDKEELPIPKRRKLKKEYYQQIETVHKSFNKEGNNLDAINRLIENISLEDFLYSNVSWEFIVNTYLEKYENESFIDYFWTIRNMHIPLWEIFKAINRIPRIKIVHSPSTGYAGFLAGLLKLNRNIPYILTEHGIYTRERKIDLLTSDWFSTRRRFLKSMEESSGLEFVWNKFFESIGRFSYYTADKILSLYEKARQIQIEYGAPKEKTMVIPNGVNIDRLKSCLEKRPSKNPKVIGLIGRVVPIKDIKTFIKAMRIVVNKIPDAEGWVVGPTDEDPEYYEECKNLVKVLDLEKNVKFLGFQNILDIFPKISVNTLTSISEGMPLSILEGFAAGVPAVTTDVGSCFDIIYGGLNEEDKKLGNAGFVCKVADAKDLAKHYIKLLENEALWKKCQQVALERVNKFYTQELFFSNYKKLYYEALSWQE